MHRTGIIACHFPLAESRHKEISPPTSLLQHLDEKPGS